MRRRDCLGLVGTCVVCVPALARVDPQEQARIDRLIQAVGKRGDIVFIRNGKEYNSTQAAEFLEGKLKWRLGRVGNVQDFIDQIGTRSTTSGDIYTVRMKDGSVLPSAVFLRQELERIERPR
jgi:hypothetical protein